MLPHAQQAHSNPSLTAPIRNKKPIPPKMRPLASTQLMMTWLSMRSADDSTTPRQRNQYEAYTSAILIVTVFGFAASLAYCLTFISTDFNGAAFAFMVAVVEFGLFYVMIAAILMRHRIDGLYSGLTTIYENRKFNLIKSLNYWGKMFNDQFGTDENEESFRYLNRANNTSEWMWTIFRKWIVANVVCFAATSLLSILYCFLTKGDLIVDHYYRPGKFLLPWNQSTHAGYFAELLFSTLVSCEGFILIGTPLLLFISLCLHHQAFYKMFKRSIDKSEKCDAKLLCDLIRFHISAKDWFLDSAIVYRSFVLVQLICSAVMMTISVFFPDLQWQQFDFIVATVVITIAGGVSTLFLYCYFGKLATESYEMMSDCVYKMEWYEQPNELQKRFILIIQNMQKPIYYHGFYVANLDLQTFIKLCRSVYSYYMVIKTLAAK